MTAKPNLGLEDEEGPYKFGPWKKGLNTLQQDYELDPDELRLAINVDITNDGHVRRRRGSSRVYTGSNVHSVGVDLLFMEGSSLKRYSPSTATASTLKTGITPLRAAVYEKVNDTIYWSNGADMGKVDSSFTHYPWGLQVPLSPALTAGSGGVLAAGRYMVVTSFQAANGEESGTGLASYVDVASSGSISVSGIVQPQSGQNITRINIYVSASGGEVMYLHGYVAVGTTTYLIQSVETTTRKAPHRFLTGPPAGNLLTNRFGRIYSAKGNVISWTEPFAYSLHDPARDYAVMDSDVKVMRAVSSGIWIVTEGGTFWLNGDNPNEASLVQKATYSAPLQSAVDIPEYNDSEGVAWLSYNGWVVGSENGEFKNLSEERVSVNQSGDRAITLYREKNSIRQFVGLISGSTRPSINSDDYNALL